MIISTNLPINRDWEAYGKIATVIGKSSGQRAGEAGFCAGEKGMAYKAYVILNDSGIHETHVVDVIKYEGRFWLVPEWLDNHAEKNPCQFGLYLWTEFLIITWGTLTLNSS